MCITIFRAFGIENTVIHASLTSGSMVQTTLTTSILHKKDLRTEAFDFTSAVDLDLINRLYPRVCTQKKIHPPSGLMFRILVPRTLRHQPQKSGQSTRGDDR
jgi:hypothetical protein